MCPVPLTGSIVASMDGQPQLYGQTIEYGQTMHLHGQTDQQCSVTLHLSYYNMDATDREN